jgi:hypothetical protein
LEVNCNPEIPRTFALRRLESAPCSWRCAETASGQIAKSAAGQLFSEFLTDSILPSSEDLTLDYGPMARRSFLEVTTQAAWLE